MSTFPVVLTFFYDTDYLLVHDDFDVDHEYFGVIPISINARMKIQTFKNAKCAIMRIVNKQMRGMSKRTLVKLLL